MSNRKRILLTVVAMVLVCAVSVMGTLAYLQMTSAPVTNTFVAAGLAAELTLDEAPAVQTDNSGQPLAVGHYRLDDTATRIQSNSYTVVPGVDLPKDPKVTIDTLEVDAYLFIKVEDSTPSTISWTLNSGWTALAGQTGVYYRAVTPGDHEFELIYGNELTVDGAYAAPAAGTTEQLIFNAYLCQAGGFASAAEAWAACFASTNP